jgi:hypothetical protein
MHIMSAETTRDREEDKRGSEPNKEQQPELKLKERIRLLDARQE